MVPGKPREPSPVEPPAGEAVFAAALRRGRTAHAWVLGALAAAWLAAVLGAILALGRCAA